MRKFYCKTPTAWFAALALMPLSACSDLGTGAPEISKGESNVVAFKIAGIPYQDSSADNSEKLTSVNVFHFKGDEFLIRTDVDDPYAESIGIPNNGTTRIYCVSGAELTADEGSKESDFALTTIASPAGADSAPLFYSATADMDEEVLQSRQLTVELKRGVARIDFINDANSNVEIKQVVVEDAPASTFVFACDSMPDDATVRYSHEFSEPFYGSEAALFTLFESNNPVHVRIIGDYGDTPVNIRTTLPSVERNKVYTLQIVNVSSNVEGAFTIKDWEEGKNVGAVPSSTGLLLDKLNSVVPEEVEVNYGTNTISVPFEGAKDIKLAFLAKTKVSVTKVEGEISTAKVTPNEPVKVEEGYISSFNLSVEPNNRLAYSLIINVKDEEGRYDFVDVTVQNNPIRKIETVEIAGLTWMAFNAMTSDPNVQIFPIDGLTIEEMYQNNWASSVGSFFQYGRALNYSPWTKNDPNGNQDTPRNIPWASPDNMPVPEGYHVATANDWRTLMPNGTTIPSTYTAGNGELIKAELITLPGTLDSSPSVSANKAGLLMRYMRFESQETGNVLIIPICGMKTASWDEYPGGGRALHAWCGYWIMEDRCLWLFQVGGTEEEPVITQKSDKWNYDGFMAVRGVKNPD